MNKLNIAIIAIVVLGVGFVFFISSFENQQISDTNKNEKYPYRTEVFNYMYDDLKSKRPLESAKSFADAIPKVDPKEIILAHRKKKNDTDFDAKAFVEKYWNISAPSPTNFKTDSTNTILEHIDRLWSVLTRNDGPQVEFSSKISLPNPYVVKNGMATDMTYADSYFTMLGLKAAGKEEMVKGMLDNFVYLIDEFGYVPQGNRTYQISRSNPPHFVDMVRLYADMKEDESILLKYLPQIEKEYQWWMRGKGTMLKAKEESEHVVKLNDSLYLNRYFDSNPKMREEAYHNDERSSNYALRGAQESGWVYSTRWMSNLKNFYTLRTHGFVAVDLNALLYNMETVLASIYKDKGDEAMSNKYTDMANQRKRNVDEFLWSDSLGVYKDYRFSRTRLSGSFNMAMLYPLYTKMASKDQADKVIQYATNNMLRGGGIVATTQESTYKFDSPYGWPHHQWIALVAMDNYGYKKEARELATRWMSLNEKVYNNTGKMSDKYNVINLNLKDGGATYKYQDGFAMTNAIYLAMKEYLENEGD